MHRILRADPVSLTSRRFFSPLDADPSRRLPQGPAPSCGEPWAAARARRPSPAPCDMRSSLTGAGTRASRDVAGGGRATVARPDLRGTAPGLRRRAVRPCGGAHPGPTPHGKAQSEASASRRLRFSVTSPPGRRGAQPPASLRGTMKSGPTGQMRSSNPPPGCGGGCARACKPRPADPAARKDAVGVYTNRRKRPLDVGLGHLCTLLRASCIG